MQPERVFVDANVLISGLVFKGNERELIRLALVGAVRLVIAEAVVRETRRVLAEKFVEYLPEFGRLLSRLSYELVPDPSARRVIEAAKMVRDPDDAPVLASILASKPDVALTGDKDLLTDEVRAIAPTCRCADYLQKRNE